MASGGLKADAGLKDGSLAEPPAATAPLLIFDPPWICTNLESSTVVDKGKFHYVQPIEVSCHLFKAIDSVCVEADFGSPNGGHEEQVAPSGKYSA
jgi:hypothetical protein